MPELRWLPAPHYRRVRGLPRSENDPGVPVSEQLGKYMRMRDRPQRDSLAPGERVALRNLRQEARREGATLASDGKGGLPPSLALGVFRRDGFRCKRCGGREDLGLHHKAFAEASPKWAAREKTNDPRGIVVTCDSCHDAIHDEGREADKEG